MSRSNPQDPSSFPLITKKCTKLVPQQGGALCRKSQEAIRGPVVRNRGDAAARLHPLVADGPNGPDLALGGISVLDLEKFLRTLRRNYKRPEDADNVSYTALYDGEYNPIITVTKSRAMNFRETPIKSDSS